MQSATKKYKNLSHLEVARFISVDPLQFKYPIYTPYQYAGNKPVSFIDLDGAEESPLGLSLIGKKMSEPVKGNDSKYIPYENNYWNNFKLRETTSFKGRQYETVSENYIDWRQKKISIQSQIYMGKNIKHPILHFSRPNIVPYSNFPDEDINQIKGLYIAYQNNNPKQYTVHNAGRCIDILNNVLSSYYSFSREIFLDKNKFSQNYIPELLERIDYTGLKLYNLGYVSNFSEIKTTNGDNVQLTLLNMIDSNIPAQHLFIISAGSGYHTTAMILDNRDTANPTFTFLDTGSLYEGINYRETQEKYKSFEDENSVTRIYHLKPKK